MLGSLMMVLFLLARWKVILSLFVVYGIIKGAITVIIEYMKE